MKADLLGLAKEWNEEARRKRGVVESDPIAATLDYCAAELLERITVNVAEDRPLTPKEYAMLHRISRQAVTGRIHRGELEAYRDDRGHWRIPSRAA